MLRLLEAQTAPPALAVVSASAPHDVEPLSASTLPVEYIFGPAGSCAQRNRGLERIHADFDLVVFFDDDFLPAADWLARCREVFAAHPDVVGLTGLVVKDGVCSKALDWDEGAALLAGTAASRCAADLTPVDKLYGCNMAFRLAAIADLRFDERLVLYGWLEDLDFSRAMLHRGRLVQAQAARGVHLGLRGGRTSGRRFGYAQIVNVWYLHGKGALSTGEAWSFTWRALLANSARALIPEPHIDRRGRLAGNLLGLRELLGGRCRPERGREL